MEQSIVQGIESYLIDKKGDKYLQELSRSLGLHLFILDHRGEVIFNSPLADLEMLTTRANYSVAIMDQNHSYGTLIVSRQDNKPLPDETKQTMVNLALHLATAMTQEIDLHEQQSQLAKQVATLQKENEILASLTSFQDASNSDNLNHESQIVELANLLTEGYLLVSLMSQEYTHIHGAIGRVTGQQILGAPLDWEEISTRIFTSCLTGTGGFVKLPDGFLPEIESICDTKLSISYTPIQSEDRVVGFLAIMLPLSQGDLSSAGINGAPFVALANRIGHILQGIQLKSELHGFLFNTVKSLVAAVDAKDPYTRGHSERVHYLAVKIGEHMNLPVDELNDLSWAALLHDIGKIGISRKILTKPSSLSDDEWVLIKEHPDQGCKVIGLIPQLAGTLDGIRFHHERLNGRGYPLGLSGSEIPLQARIIGVADSFDAITSSRAYSDPTGCEAALEILEGDVGTLYEQELVSALRTVISDEIDSGSLAFETLRTDVIEANKSKSA